MENIRRDSGADIDQGLSAYHVQGYLWKLCKNTQSNQTSWSNLENGSSRTWNLNGEGYIAQDSTIYPRWFFACENRCQDVQGDANCCTPAIIKSTDADKMAYNKPDFVAPFDTEETYLRSKDDKFTPKTPADIYDEAKNRKPGKERRSLPILPLPGRVEAEPSSTQINKVVSSAASFFTGFLRMEKKCPKTEIPFILIPGILYGTQEKQVVLVMVLSLLKRFATPKKNQKKNQMF